MRPATPRPFPILDDDWEPPPRASRFPVGLTATVFVTVCIAVLAVGALSTPDPARVTQDPYAYALPTASAARVFTDSGVAPLEPDFVPPRLSRRPMARRAPRPAPAPPPAPAPSVARPAGRPLATPLAPSAPAYLAINSTPWAELSVDGRAIGNTPQLGIVVTPGRHLLTFARDGFETQSTWVTVESGTTMRITDIILKRIAP